MTYLKSRIFRRNKLLILSSKIANISVGRIKNKKLALIVLSLIPFCAGCVMGNPYGTIFNNAVAIGKSEVLYTSKPFDDFLKTFTRILENVGYERAIYRSSDGSFFVAVKKINIAGAFLYGDPTSYKILIKLTEWDNGRTRIDLVNGSTYIGAKGQVAADIKTIAQKIEAADLK